MSNVHCLEKMRGKNGEDLGVYPLKLDNGPRKGTAEKQIIECMTELSNLFSI